MSKIKNLLDPESLSGQSSNFYLKLLSGKLKPDDLAKMSDEDLLLVHESETDTIAEIASNTNVFDTIAEVASNTNVFESIAEVASNTNTQNTSSQGDSDENIPLSVLSKNFQKKYGFSCH